MIIKKYQIYIFNLFLKNFFIVSFVFLCIALIINTFEEIRFFEKYNVEIYYALYLSALNAPSLLFEIFPFIFLIATNYFYIVLKDKNELDILKSNGISNMRILSILSFLSIILGICLILFFYSLSSNLKSRYLEVKNKFSNTNEYLAVVNENGLWIKEELDNRNFIIHAEKFDNNNLRSITITESDKYYQKNNTLKAETANITAKNWSLKNVTMTSKDGGKKNYLTYVYNSSFNGEIISKLFSNLNSLNIYQLHELSNNYQKIGYSNKDVKIHLNKIYSMSVFYVLMSILGYLLIKKTQFIKSTFFSILFSVFVSVLVYYLNYFSNLLGSNGTLPIYLSVWTPHLILFLICSIGLVRINENT